MTSPALVTSERTEAVAGLYHDEWLYRYGPERLEQNDQYPVSELEIEGLVQKIGHLCTGSGGRIGIGSFSFTLDSDSSHPPVAFWNDGSIAKGFGPGVTDFARAGVKTWRYEEGFALMPRHSNPWGKHAAAEDFFIDPYTSLPVIRRTVLPLGRLHMPQKYVKDAYKVVNGLEVAEINTILDSALEAERGAIKPKFVELGYGLDPAAFGGNRDFSNKEYIGIEAALGEYVTGREVSYSDAVKEDTDQFRSRVRSERSDENILFDIARGTQLPFGDQTVREVFASNIFNAPDINLDAKEGLLAEVHRVLEQRGRLVLRINWHQDEWAVGRTTELLTRKGFDILKVIGSDRPSYKRLEEVYGTQQNVKAPAGYYVIAQVSE